MPGKKKNRLFRVLFEKKVSYSFSVSAPSQRAASTWAKEVALESEEVRELIDEIDREREFNCEQPQLVCAKIEEVAVPEGREVSAFVTVDNFGQEIAED